MAKGGMTVTGCSITGCGKAHLARGWCATHYQKWQRWGDPEGGRPRYTSPEASFAARVEPMPWTDCLVWVGSANPKGYGQLRVHKRMVSAHRYAWERERGPIPPDLEVDHICHVRSCVNVAHLRLATRAENVRNKAGAEHGHDLPRGVYRSGRRFVVRINNGGKAHYGGLHDTPELASDVADSMRRRLYGDFAGRR